MRIRGQQEMSAAQNQLMLNGKVLLPKSLPNENDHHPQLIPQYGFPFAILPNNEDRYPISIIPNLNSLPERTASGGINDLTCTPSTPVTLDKNKRIQDRLIPEVIDIVDDSETDGNMLRNEIPMLQPSAEKPMGLFFSNMVMSSHIVSSLPNEGENNLAMPSGNASLQQLEMEEHERRENQGIDLNKTPQQKPRRKKHRPKVIREGNSAKTPKPVTPKPVTPKPARNNASPNSSGKRKYVRKKKVDNSLDNVIYPSCEILDPNSTRGTKSARRCLNFNSEEPQARNGQPGSLMFACNPELQAQCAEELQARNERPEPLIFARNVQTQDTEDSQARNGRPGSLMFTGNAELKVQGVEEPQVRNGRTEPLMFARNVHTQDPEGSRARIGHPGSLMFGCNAELQAQGTPVSGIFTSSRNQSAMSSVQGREVVGENSPERNGLNINRLINQVPNEYIRIPQTPTPHSQPSRRQAIKMDHMLKGNIRVAKIPTPPPQPSRREILQENLKAFARMNGYMKIAASSDKSLTGQKTQVDANDTPDVLLSGTKRHHNHVDESHAHINFSRAYNGINEINECHVTSRDGPHFPQIQKKMRTEEQSELASNASSVTSNPSGRWEQNLVMQHNREVLASADTQRQMTTSWKTGLMVPNNCEVFTFADAQRMMAFEKLRTSERMLSFAQREVQTSQIVKVPVLNQDGFNNMNCSQLIPEKVSRCNVSQGSKPCGPQTCIEATNPTKIKTKSCNKREQIRLVKPMSSNTKKTPLQEYEAAVFSYGSSHAQKSAQLTASASRNFRDKNTSLPVSSVQDCQSSSNFKESRSDISMSGAIVPYGDHVDDLVRKLKCLNITGGHEIVRVEPQNALVPYGGGGSTMVPYEGPFDPIKKRRPRPKVDLDEETNRVWKVLMGKETTDEAIDMDKEKWWEEERRIVHGRVDSFIARMHLVQGDRRFSKWKGSVVDSVVGVFLTQNVSDHLSSSAFMNLAARFPLKQNGNNSKPNPEKMSGFTEQQEGCIITFDDDTKWKESMLGKELYPQGPFVIPEDEHTAERETTSSNEQVGSNTNGSVIDYSNGIGLDAHERELKIGHESHDNRADTSVTVTGSTSAAETEDRISTEDVVSSQNSVMSSQNFSECLNQTAENVKLSSLSNWDMEDITNGSMGSGLDNSTSFMELLQMAETTRFQELYSHGNGRMNSMEYGGEVGNRKSTSDLRGKCSSMYRSNSHPREIQHDFMGLSCAPSPSFTFQNSLNSRSMAMANINEVREVSSSHVHSTVSGANIANNFEKMSRNSPPSKARSSEFVGQHNFMGGPYAASSLFHLHNSYARLMAMGKVSTSREESSSHLPPTASGLNTTNSFKIASGRCGPAVENSTEAMGQHDFMGVSSAPSPSYNHHNFSNGRLDNVNAEREESRSHLPSRTLGMSAADKIKTMGERFCPLTESTTEFLGPLMPLSTSRTKPVLDTPACKNSVQPLSSSKTEVRGDNHSCCHGDLQKEVTESSSGKNTTHQYSHSQDERTDTFQQKERGMEFQANCTEHAVSAQVQLQSGRVHQTFSSSHNNSKETFEVAKAVESNLTDKAYGSKNASIAMANGRPKAQKVKAEAQKKKTYDWDTLRKQACPNGAKRERCSDAMDSVDWEALRTADESVVAHTIRERGMNNLLAERIKKFLDRIVKDHGSIDLEWLRDVPPDRAKDYLLSIRGLGLKSVECVRLLTLHHLAFPVDTNVGRICVRLGWVPLQPLPESLQLHLLEMYPVLETIQKYLWPRLCKLDQRTLYELHYQMITFGKVFCTKSKPNCNACPMRAECRHFASAFASARFTLPGPEEKGLVNSTVPISPETHHAPVLNPMLLPQLEGGTPSQGALINNCEPIIEEPMSPEFEYMDNSKTAIEDDFYEDPDEIPTINLNLEEFTQTVNKYMHENNMELQDGDISKALVAISPDAASIPVPKLKNVSRLRTEHQVYELPDSHPLLEGLDRREPDDPCSYFLAIWSPGETARSIEPPKVCCNSQDTGALCDKNECFTCNSQRESQSQTVRGTLLIPCRTAMRGSFPLNGTYFQVNEVFADHDSSLNPIYVSRQCIWNLPRRTVYFGTSIPTIFKGLTTGGIQQCFWRGFVCVRGFDRRTRAPKPLYARLHFPASKTLMNKKKAAAAAVAAATTTVPAREDE